MLIAILIAHVVMLSSIAIGNSPTQIEINHFHGGLMHWWTGEFNADPGNPPVVNMIAALPALADRPRQFAKSFQFTDEAGSRIFDWITAGRLKCVPWSVLGGFICFRWASELFGTLAGFCALLLWCICPLVLAFGSLITGDMAATAMGVTALYGFRRWLMESAMWRATIVGFAIGVAHLTKYVWVIMTPLCAVLWLIWRALDPERRARFSWLREIGHICVMGVLTLYVINLGFGFDKTFQPADTFQLVSQRLGPISRYFSTAIGTEGEPAANWLAMCPVPLPAQYFGGIDAVAGANERENSVYFQGEWRTGGYWDFYVVGLLVTLPLGLLLLSALAGVLWMTSNAFRLALREELFLAIPSLVILIFVSSVTTIQYLRYVLPMLPFLIIWTSRAAKVFERPGWGLRGLVAGAFLWSVGSSLYYFPHCLGYFNELAGGPTRGHAYLMEHWVDIGQDLFRLKYWCDEHADARPMHIAYFGPVKPKHVGLDSLKLSGMPGENRSLVQGLVPGWHAVSLSYLRGEDSGYNYLFDHFQPVGRAGYSIYIYHIDLESANAFRRKHGLPLLPEDDRG